MAYRNPNQHKMNNVVQTKFVGRSPFKPQPKEVDVSTLRITDDKKKVRAFKVYKYDPIFKQLAPSKSIACKSEDTDKICQALRGYIKRKNKPWKVSAVSYYTATTGRVFVEEV